MSNQLLLTKVSTAHWCSSDGTFEPARIPTFNREPGRIEETSWFDRLFEGGIVLPELEPNQQRALTILLTGPPGSGKSTLALELCHRWTKAAIVTDGRCEIEPWSSLYLTSETTESWATQKAASFGWQQYPIKAKDGTTTQTAFPLSVIWETTQFREYLGDEKGLSALLKAVANLFGPVGVHPEPLIRFLEGLWRDAQTQRNIVGEKPRVLIIDSLNTVEADQQTELFNRFSQLIHSGPRIIVTILESDSTQERADFWEYVSDIVIRLDRNHDSRYLIRTIEVVKARYQPHLWGQHQLKIYPGIKASEKTADQKRRAHPYRQEGGIYIYPSIHSYLSVYKQSRRNSDPEIPFPTPISTLNDVLHGGFPQGRCTGLIGVRGGHKSHLGYYCLLNRILNSESDEKCLIVSLRDADEVAKRTLNRILNEERSLTGNLDRLMNDDRIEVLYYPPGYVSPEEFFHKLFLSVQRLKHRGTPGESGVTVLFNSLDQLSSRFPLCAREQMFIPGIIEALSAEGVTSFFIAVEEPGQPPEQYGLLSMADALLSFKRENLARDDYLGHLGEYLGQRKGEQVAYERHKEQLPNAVPTVTMRVVRYAGGQAAGAGGLLELVENQSVQHGLFGTEGLHFVPFSPRFGQRFIQAEDDVHHRLRVAADF